MVRLADHLLLLSALALASPLPHRAQQADQVNSIAQFGDARDGGRPPRFGSGPGRATDRPIATYTIWAYTTVMDMETASLQPILTTEAPESATELISAANSFSPTPSFEISISASQSNVSIVPMTTMIAANASSASQLSATNPGTIILSTGVPFNRSTSVTTAQNASYTSPPTANTTCRPPAIPPAPVNPGTVDRCTLWYVAQAGDYCSTVAQQFGISVDTFMAWNPSVLPPTCLRMLAGDAYCVQVCGTEAGAASSLAPAVSSAAFPTLSTSTPLPAAPTAGVTASATSPSSTEAPLDVYRSYNGDGTAAQGWPTEDQWVSFDYMFASNTPSMELSCQAWGVPDNTPSELATLREQILSVGDETGVDPRFILAVILQESTACVRVITTQWSHANPGLMQSFNGSGTCNTNNANLLVPGVSATGVVQTPCPESAIRQQILDGTNGTVWGPGLVQDLQAQGATDESRWYRAARLYNGGSLVEGNLALPCCTPSYASDIANRLTGWVRAARTFVAS